MQNRNKMESNLLSQGLIKGYHDDESLNGDVRRPASTKTSTSFVMTTCQVAYGELSNGAKTSGKNSEKF